MRKEEGRRREKWKWKQKWEWERERERRRKRRFDIVQGYAWKIELLIFKFRGPQVSSYIQSIIHENPFSRFGLGCFPIQMNDYGVSPFPPKESSDLDETTTFPTSPCSRWPVSKRLPSHVASIFISSRPSSKFGNYWPTRVMCQARKCAVASNNQTIHRAFAQSYLSTSIIYYSIQEPR